MKELMNLIDKTDVHYVRCFKPNNINKSNVFNRVKILDQLNNNGILETIKVSRNCFPVKYTYAEFNELYLFNKYDCNRLLKPNIETDNIFNIFNQTSILGHVNNHKLTNAILKAHKYNIAKYNTPNDYQFGKTKIF